MSQDPHPARVAVNVKDARLRAHIRELLDREAFDIQVLQSARDLLEGSTPADLAVVGKEALEAQAPELLEAAREERAPGVIVVADDVDEAERARLIAAGAAGVVDPREHQDRLVALARAEARGGLDGPEVPGAEAEPRLADFASRNNAMKEFLDLVRRVADSDATLLIGGETGVGKERLARAIHAESSRRDGSFVAVNCGALPENLLESELFGHEKGAFTGADATRPGRFELAAGGTLFLDEIGEMPTHLQVKLLNVLQRREVQRLGAARPVPVDVRVMAATHRDLAEDVREGRFREDLLFRLNVVTLTLPPLRERAEDVADLTGSFIKHLRRARGLEQIEGITDGAMEALLAYDWPGNVRELANVVERAMLLARGARIERADLPPHLCSGPAALAAGGSPAEQRAWEEAAAHLDLPLAAARARVLDAFERSYLTGLLELHSGHVGNTARAAGINPRTLYEKMRKHGLAKEDFKRSAR